MMEAGLMVMCCSLAEYQRQYETSEWGNMRICYIQTPWFLAKFSDDEPQSNIKWFDRKSGGLKIEVA